MGSRFFFLLEKTKNTTHVRRRSSRKMELGSILVLPLRLDVCAMLAHSGGRFAKPDEVRDVGGGGNYGR